MKANLQMDDEEIQAIARQVAEHLKPMIKEGKATSRAPLMDVKAVAIYLEVKPDWVYKKVAERGIPFLKVGRYNKFKKSEIDKWLASQAVHPLSANPAVRVMQKRIKGNEDS